MLKASIIILMITLIFSIFHKLNAQEKLSITKEIQPPIKTVSEYQTGKWQVSVKGGFAYRLAKTGSSEQYLINQGFEQKNVEDYFKQLKTGYKVSGQLHYMFWENIGLGINYQFHNSSGSLSGYIDPGDVATYVFVNVTSNIFTNFIGGSFLYKSWIKPTPLNIYTQISAGLTMYREETIVSYSPSLITGNAFGGNVELGIEYFIMKNFAISLSANTFQSTISKVKINDGKSTNEVELPDGLKEELTRVDINLGIRVCF